MVRGALEFDTAGAVAHRPLAGDEGAAIAASGDATIHGHIAAQIDRLPLTWVQWQLAILVEITWNLSSTPTASALGAISLRLAARQTDRRRGVAVIQALQVGLGILLGA